MVENIWGEVAASDLLVLLVALSVLLAVVLLLTDFIGRRLMSLSVEDAIVLQFCGSKNSLASGLPIVSLLFPGAPLSSEEHTSELQSLMPISYAVFCLKITHS